MLLPSPSHHKNYYVGLLWKQGITKHMFLVRWWPLVAVVIITAAKEEARQCNVKSGGSVQVGGWERVVGSNKYRTYIHEAAMRIWEWEFTSYTLSNWSYTCYVGRLCNWNHMGNTVVLSHSSMFSQIWPTSFLAWTKLKLLFREQRYVLLWESLARCWILLLVLLHLQYE